MTWRKRSASCAIWLRGAPKPIVLTGAAHSREATRMLLSADVPIIEIADLPSNPIGHVIGFSNHRVGRTAARFLIERGLTRIGAIGGSAEGSVVDHRGEERMRGFEDELAQSGLSTEGIMRFGQAPLNFDPRRGGH